MKRVSVCLLLILCLLSAHLSASALSRGAVPPSVGYSPALVLPPEAGDAQDILVLRDSWDSLAEADPWYRISDAEGLLLFSVLVNQSSLKFDVYLSDDIDLSGVRDFVPIGNSTAKPESGIPMRLYSGRFYGCGHRIDGLRMESAGPCCSLFGTVGPGAVIRDLIIGENCLFRALGEDAYASSLVGRMIEGANLTNVLSLATVSGAACGGLVARLDNAVRSSASSQISRLQNCGFAGTVVSEGTAGGLIGLCRGSASLSACRNTGAVQASAAGGMIGSARCAIDYNGDLYDPRRLQTSLSLSHCQNHGNLNASESAGALCGVLENRETDGIRAVELLTESCLHTGGIRGGAAGAGAPFIGRQDADTDLSGCTDRSGEVRLHGSQMKQEADGTWSVRLIGSIADPGYRELGYRVTVDWNGRQVSRVFSCRTVYQSMRIDDDPLRTAQELRGTEEAYLCILAITDIPEDTGRIVLTVTPYGIRTDGVQEEGETCRIVYEDGANIPGWKEGNP